jgi:carbamoyl-phosphate synthase large subunit
MRAGETDKAITVKSSWLEGIGEAIGRNLGHIGVLDCDAIVSEDRCYVLDLNPRFSGCYPFSQIAGANLPAAFVAWANSKQPDARWLRVEPDIVASKYEEVVVVQKNEPLTRRAVDQPDSLKNEPVVLST